MISTILKRIAALAFLVAVVVVYFRLTNSYFQVGTKKSTPA